MPDAKQEIHDLDKYLRGKGGANFEKYYKAGVRGLSDIDMAYVRYGYLIFNEEKETKGEVLPLNYAQFMLFKAIQELNPEKTRCYVSVWHNNEIYVFSIKSLIESFEIKIYNSKKKRWDREYEPFLQNYPLKKADRIFDEGQYYRWFANRCKACDEGFK